jgi:HEAT repeat protein
MGTAKMLAERLRVDLFSTNADQQVAAARQLCEQRNWDALPLLLRLLAQDECGFSVAQALVAFGPEVCHQVELLLMDENKRTQYRAAWILAHFGDKRAARPLLDALKEPFFNDQYVPALSRLGVPDLDRTLVRELSRHRQDTNHPSACFRSATFLWALTQMRSQAAVDLAPHFTHEAHHRLVRQRAAHYLQTIAPEQREA